LDPKALELFIRVGEFSVEKGIWHRSILRCFYTHNFSFVKQFFYPLHEVPPREVTEEALIGLPAASTEPSLLEEWTDKGLANAALWCAIYSGLWKSPAS